MTSAAICSHRPGRAGALASSDEATPGSIGKEVLRELGKPAALVRLARKK